MEYKIKNEYNYQISMYRMLQEYVLSQLIKIPNIRTTYSYICRSLAQDLIPVKYDLKKLNWIKHIMNYKQNKVYFICLMLKNST